MLKISTQTLIEVGRRCKPFAIHNINNVHPAFSHVFFTENFAVASTGYSGIVVFVPETLAEPFTVDNEILLKLASCTQAEEVQIDRIDRQNIRLSADTYRVKLDTLAGEERLFPQLNIPQDQTPFPAGLWSAMKDVYDFVTQDETIPGARGILAANGYVYATDMKRIAKQPYDGDAETQGSIFFPDSLIHDAIHGPPPIAYARANSDLWLWWDTHMIFGRLSEHEFPDCEGVIQARTTQQALAEARFSPARMQDSVGRMMLFTSQHRERAKAILGPEQLRLEWSDESKTAEEIIPVVADLKNHPRDREFFINLRSLKDCLEANAFQLYQQCLLFKNDETHSEVICGLVV